MTPEAAHEEGKRAARSFIEESAALSATYTSADAFEDFVSGYSDEEHVTPFHLRGGAEYFREFAQELEARAAALEATR